MNGTKEDMETHLAWQRVRLICGPYWHQRKREIIVCTLAATALMFGSATIMYFAGKIAGEAMTLMQRQDYDKWKVATQLWVAIMLAYMVSTVAYEYLRTKLANDGFQLTVENVVRRWYQPGIFDKARQNHRLKSPEAAMTQAFEDFFNGLVGLSMAAVSYLFDLIMGSIQLFEINKNLMIEAIAWSILGTVVVTYVGKSLIKLSNDKGELDGALRTAITNANEVDPSEAEEEREKVLVSLSAVMEVRNRMLSVNRNVSAVTYPFNKWTEILGMVVMAPLFFQHLFNGATPMEIGAVTTASLAFSKSVSSMTMFVQQFNGITSWLSNIKRAGVFCEVLEEYERGGPAPAANGIVPRLIDQLCRFCLR
ncbi:MAG: hypothetical protein JST44_27580 [Cyanobacteria bacterium SZAS LIN-5]|nr:hypothetical protein [Cyanobacteria bacterium SZAS LIN-5]